MLYGDVLGVLLGVGARTAAANIQEGKSIPHAALGQAGNQLGCILVDLDSLLLADKQHLLGDDRRADAPEVEPLATGENGRRNLVNLCRSQNKNHVLRRLLHDFEQGIECAHAEHMGFVDDIDPVAGNGRGEVCLLAQLTNTVYAVVACCVDFGDIQNRAVVDSAADIADTAGISVVLVRAVDRFGNNLGAGGLAGAAGAGEQIGMADVAAGNFLLEGGGDMLLTHDLVKVFGTIFSVQRLIHSRVCPLSTVMKRAGRTKA